METPLSLFIREYNVIAVFIFLGSVAFSIFFNDRKFFKFGFVLFLVLTAAYLPRNLFIFFFLLLFIVQLYSGKASAKERLIYYLFLLPFIPMSLAQKVPFPGLEQLITLNYPRALNLIVLLPIFLNMIAKPERGLFLKQADKYVILFFAYLFLLAFRATTFTNSFRIAFNLFVDYFLIYFVISRATTEIEDFEKLFESMIFIGFIFAMIGIFETIKGWNLYVALFEIPGVEGGGNFYTQRSGFLRATGPLMGPIIFGTYLYIMIGFLIFLKYVKQKVKIISFILIIGLFFFAIFCTFSRGPLLGAFVFFVIFAMLQGRKIAKALSILPIVFFLLMLSPIGETIISTLPFIGRSDQGSIEYRKILWQNSLKVIERSAWFGNDLFQDEPEIEELTKRGGNIGSGKGADIVNSYIGIALRHGLIGLALFMFLILATLLNLWRGIRSAAEEDAAILGKILFSLLVSVLVSMATVSMVSMLPIYLWLLLAFSNGYAHIIKLKRSTA